MEESNLLSQFWTKHTLPLGTHGDYLWNPKSYLEGMVYFLWNKTFLNINASVRENSWRFVQDGSVALTVGRRKLIIQLILSVYPFLWRPFNEIKLKFLKDGYSRDSPFCLLIRISNHDDLTKKKPMYRHFVIINCDNGVSNMDVDLTVITVIRISNLSMKMFASSSLYLLFLISHKEGILLVRILFIFLKLSSSHNTNIFSL